MERLELADLPPRAGKCRAVFLDDGLHRSAPKCMGGAVLLGCFKTDECIPPDIGYRTNELGVVVHLWERTAPESGVIT